MERPKQDKIMNKYGQKTIPFSIISSLYSLKANFFDMNKLLIKSPIRLITTPKLPLNNPAIIQEM